MSFISESDLRVLLEASKGPCVSIFLPTHRAGPATLEDRIRLKNLLDEAEERLIASGLRRPEAENVLEPARHLSAEGIFREHPCDGLAIFLSPALFRAFCLPLQFAELVVVSDRFHLKALFPLLTGDGRFYVLALSQNDVRLLLCTRYSVKEIELKGVPKSMEEALQYDNLQQQLRFRPDRAGGTGVRTAIWYGQGEEQDNTKDYLLTYCRRIDEGLHALLRDEQVPLVLAGVEYLLPIYREANTYLSLVDAGIPGNPDRLSAAELHERAWAVMQPIFEKAREDAADRYGALAGTGLTSDELEAILPAAFAGRVDSLFVAVGHQRWGRFDPDTETVHVHPEPEPGDEDLLDRAAIQTLLHDGEVYALNEQTLPCDSLIAAVFRY
ncbi:MAG: hypothetical protein M5U01_42585 [Ardenticatenaceae bacterium]|nr:hypothetical protein [Ardenticatenaceae bacterium]